VEINPKDYLRIRFDDPILPDPVTAVLFQSEDGSSGSPRLGQTAR